MCIVRRIEEKIENGDKHIDSRTLVPNALYGINVFMNKKLRHID